jgi:hypothetical protein
MKKALLLTAVVLAAASANASKSRLAALGGSNHLDDVQDIFVEPAKVMLFNDIATFEFGSADAYAAGTFVRTAASPHAEAGFIRKMDNAAWGLYLGKQSDSFNTFVGAAGAAATVDFLFQENPFHVFYGMASGDLQYGFAFNYSNASKKSPAAGATTGDLKSTSMGLAASVRASNWTAYLNMGLAGSSSIEATGGEIKAQMEPTSKIGATYAMDTVALLVEMNNSGVKVTNAGTEAAKVTYSDMAIAAANSIKKDGADFFYGTKYMTTTTKTSAGGTDTKTETSALPVWLGVEAEATSWMVLRAVVSQNFILGQTKTTEADSVADNTTAAAGLGLKFGKFMVDGTLNAATNGNLNLGGGTNGDKFLTQASLTYTW